MRRFELFKVGDVFNVYGMIAKAKISKAEPGSVRFVSSQGTSNGVAKYVKTEEKKEQANVITVSTIVGTAFYQPFGFVTGGKTLGMSADKLEENSALYCCTLLNEYNRLYGFKNNQSISLLSDEVIRLPVIESDDPAHIYTPDDIDWQYMNDYIQEIKKRYEMKTIKQNRQMLEEYKKLADCDECEPDGGAPAGFAVFKLGDIFDIRGIRGGTYTKKARLVPGNYRYVTGTSQNNGNTSITCGNADRLDKGNCITVNETGGGPFYQPFDFVGYGPLVVLRREGLGEQQYLYVCACMSRQNIRFGFNKGRTCKSIRKEEIALPVKEIKEQYTPDDIDWDYMGRHIAAMELKTVKTVAEMQKKEEQNIHSLAHDDK